MTVREYLDKIAKYMTERNGVSYSVKCFNYPVQMEGYGTHSDDPLERYNPILQGVIGVSRDDFTPETMFQGYLCWCWQYPEFYKKELFILCYGPERNLKFEEILNSEVNPEECHYYGLPSDFTIEGKRK